MHDLDHQLVGVVHHGHALRHRDLRDAELRLDLLERREVDLERLGDVGRQTLDVDRMQRLKDVGVATLHRG